VEVAEGVGEAGVEEAGEAFAFLIGEAGAAAVFLGAGDVDFVVGDVEVAAEDDGFLLGVAGEVVAESGVPFEAVGEAAEFVLGVWGVDVDEGEVRVFESEDAAFAIMIREVHAVVDVEGGIAGEDGDAGVAGFFGGVPEAVVAIEFRGEGDLFLAGFGFLQAEDVGFFGGDEVSEAFAEDCADAVYVPGDEVHGLEGGLGIGYWEIGKSLE